MITILLRGENERRFTTVVLPISWEELQVARTDFSGWVATKDTGPLSGSWGSLMDWWIEDQRPGWIRFDFIDQVYLQIQGEWRPSIFMRRWASRLMLEIVSARPERLKDIREDGYRAEGCYGGRDSIPKYPFSATPLEHYRSIWTKINGEKGPKSLDANPWVWVVEFRRHDS